MLEALWLPSGYLDRTFFMYVEDVDLGWRARLAGWTARYVPEARVRHRCEASSRKHGRYWTTLKIRENRVRALLKNASPQLIAAALPQTLWDAAKSVARTDLGALRALLRAFRDGLAQRAAVSRLATVDRRALERAWTEPGSGY